MELDGARIVVGIDPLAATQVALESALRLAADHGAELTVVSACQPLADRELSDVRPAVGAAHDRAREAAAELGVLIRCEARLGSPARAIVDVAREQDAALVVVGDRGMRGARRLIGSVPNTVSHSAPCSVLIVSAAA